MCDKVCTKMSFQYLLRCRTYEHNYTDPLCGSNHLKRLLEHNFTCLSGVPHSLSSQKKITFCLYIMCDKVCTKMSFSILTQMPYIRSFMAFTFLYTTETLRTNSTSYFYIMCDRKRTKLLLSNLTQMPFISM